MTLRLRLSLFYTLLVSVILIASGLTMHFLFQRSLENSFDQGMRENAQFIRSSLENEGYEYEDDELELHLDARTFPNNQTALILDSRGEVVAMLGSQPTNLNSFLQSAKPGFSSIGTTRVYVTALDGFTLVLLKSTNGIRETLWQFDRLFIILIPVAILISFGLGYLLARQALNPVDKLTRAAYDLANRRAWQESLPEPSSKDELWRLSKATNTLLASLKDVIETERRFTADAAHELRTPLTVLQGRLEQALEQTTDSKARSRLLKAHDAAEQLLELVKKLLLLARTEAGQGLSREQVALDELIFHLAENIKPLFDEKGLELKLSLPEEGVYIKGDYLALELMIRNLLDNALKFTDQGLITVYLKQDKNKIQLEIEDSGKGIPLEALDKLFDRFYQTSVKHRQKGSGLGLSLVKSIVTWHGGNIEVTNRVQAGARFTINFPTVKAAKNETAKES